jgi:hypothetical protein
MNFLKRNTLFIETSKGYLAKLTPKNKITLHLLYFVIFTFAIHLFFNFIGVYQYLSYRPCSIHTWAQCQRASIAQCYYEDSMNFFKPRTQRYTPHEGITGMEFPIIYYVGALFYKIFGFNESILRLISLVIVSLGFYSATLMSNKFLKNYIFSLIIVASAFFSPVLLFYTPNFMPDAPSVGFVLMCWYYFFKYISTLQKKHLGLFIFFGTLASLLKVVSIMCFIIVICLLIIDRTKFFKDTKNTPLFKFPLKVLKGIFFGIFIVMVWYVYASWLATHYKNETFALHPIMGNLNTIKQILDGFKYGDALYSYYAYETYMLLIVAIIFIVIGAKFINRLLLTITILYFLGNVCYVYLFLGQFVNHDYYIIALIPGVLFLLLSFGDGIKQLADKYGLIIQVAFFIVLFFNMKECIRNCWYYYDNRYNEFRTFTSTGDRSYYDLEKKLRSAGVKRTDITLSGFDFSFCNTLYLMDQVGFLISPHADSTEIANSLNMPELKYLVLNDSAKFNKIYPNHFEKKILLTHRGVIVYKLN